MKHWLSISWILLPAMVLAVGCQNSVMDVPSNAPASRAAGWLARGQGVASDPRPASRDAAGNELVPVAATAPQDDRAVAGGNPPSNVGNVPPGAMPAATPPPNPDHVSLTLARALNQSLVANPDLVALRGRLDINQAMVGVARTYPWNPFVQSQFLPQGHPFSPEIAGLPGSAAGMSNYYVWVMQRFELAHQRQFRIQGSMAGLNQTQWNIFQGELLNVAQTTRLYFAALYQKEVHELARETAELNERLATAVEQRFKANLARPGDVTTARVVARQSRRQAELADATYQAALAALYQQLNLPTPAPLDFEDRLTGVHWNSLQPICPEELAEGRPDVLAARAGVQVADAQFRLARAAMVPDVSAGPIVDTADNGTHYLGVRLQMDLPVFNNGSPLARQRRAERNFQRLTYDQLRVRATLEAEAAIKQYEYVRELALKAAQAQTGGNELREMNRQFEAGQADVLAVLTTQNNLLQERRAYLDLLNQLAQSAAAVIQATGLPAARVVQLPEVPCDNSGPPNALPDTHP